MAFAEIWYVVAFWCTGGPEFVKIYFQACGRPSNSTRWNRNKLRCGLVDFAQIWYIGKFDHVTDNTLQTFKVKGW